MKKNYQVPEIKTVMLLSQISIQVNVGSTKNGTDHNPIRTE